MSANCLHIALGSAFRIRLYAWQRYRHLTDSVAEIELSALATQCLDRRIADAETLAGEVVAWQVRRNADWRFKTEDARIKLKRLYPSIQPS